MAMTANYSWKCDGCDDQPKHNSRSLPDGWAKIQLEVKLGPAWAPEFTVCNACYLVLIPNRRTGPSWFNKLLKCVGRSVRSK